MARKALMAGLRPTHPSEFLGEIVLPATGRPKTDIAALLGVSRQTLYDVLNQRHPVTPNIALRLGKMFPNGPEFWLNMQQAHDLAVLAPDIDLDAIPAIGAAA